MAGARAGAGGDYRRGHAAGSTVDDRPVGVTTVRRLLRLLRLDDAPGEKWFDRLEAVTAGLGPRIRRYGLPLLTVRGIRRIIDVRITGLAAEMTYYALISLVPLLTALAATLGFLERLIGPAKVRDIEDGLIDSLAAIFDAQLTAEVLAPLVRGLLSQERAGVAVGGVAVALWLASRMFRAAIRALDDAYGVPERRGLFAQWALGLALALAAVVTLVVLLAMVVVGPLLGGGQSLARQIGQQESFEVIWALLRWPAVVVVCVGFLALLYRHGPNVDTTWRHCLPGALVGMVGLIGIAAGFKFYLDVATPTGIDVGQADEAVTAAAQTVGAVLAGVLWLWLSSIVILAGGVLNAEIQRMRPGRPAAVAPESG